MSYSQIFGGDTLHPSQQTYLTLTFSSDVALTWPIEQQIAGANIVSDIMDLDASAISLNVDFPDARQVSNGIQAVFVNIGANSYTVRTNTQVSIITVAPGEARVVYLNDNSTQGGTWRSFQLGATVSTSDASQLAGAGIKAISTNLNQQIESSIKALTPFDVLNADRARCLIYTAGAGVCNFPTAASVGNDWFFMIRNSGTGDLTLTPQSETVDGVSTINLPVGGSTFIFTDGSNFFTIGFGKPSVSIFDYVSIDVPGSGDFTLTGSNLDRISYRFTGALTGNRKIVVPNTVQQYWIDNFTTGAFALTIGTSAGTSPQVPQNQRAILYCDSMDVVNATTSSITFPITIAQGGTNATDAAAALTNLGGIVSTLTLTAGAGLTGGGDLSTDRTFNVGAGTGITVNSDTVELNQLSSRNTDHASVTLTAGNGLTGGGTIASNRTFDVGAGTGITVNADTVALDTGNIRNVDHGAVTLTAGTGLTGGGDLSANRTFNLDISGLTAMTAIPVGTDGFLYDDAGTMKRMSYNESAIPVTSDSGTHTFVDADVGEARRYDGATTADAWTMNTGVGQVGCGILIVNASGADGPTITGGTAQVTSAGGIFIVKQAGMAFLFQDAANVWKLTGDLTG